MMSARDQLLRLLAAGTFLLGVGTALSYGGRWSWFCELFVNFRTHFAGLAVLALLLAVAVRRWPIAAVAGVLLVLNAWPLSAMVSPGAASPAGDAMRVRVVAFNVHIENDDLARVARYLSGLDADLVILEEFPELHVAPLKELLPELPHVHSSGDLALGVAIFSRWPLRDPQLVLREGLPLALRSDVDLGDRSLRVYGIHLHWPLVPEAARVRNAQLDALGPELAACRGACVAAGDFNVTPWSSHYRDLLAASGFRDCAHGLGWLPTWTARLPSWLRIRIDQCLVSAAVGVADVQVGEHAGSDHFATINDLLVPRAAAGSSVRL